MKPDQESITLNRITLISSIGDYFTIYALMQATQQIFGNSIMSAYNIAAQALGVCLAGMFGPFFLSKVSLKKLIFLTQLVPALLLISFLIYINVAQVKTPFLIYSLTIVVTFMYNLFFTCREAHSKNVGTTKKEQNILLSTIMQNIFTAQMIGPSLAFFLITMTRFEIPILLDASTFVICAVLALRLSPTVVNQKAQNVFNPLKYLWKDSKLLKIFLMRSTAFWIPMSIYNVVIYPLVADASGKSIIYSVWTDVAMGIGAVLTVQFFKANVERLGHKLGTLTCVFNIVMAFCCLLCGIITDFSGLVFINLFMGIGMGGNALTTQAVRRHATTKDNFSEIVSLEVIIGRFNAWVLGTLTTLLLLRHFFNVQMLMWSCAVVFVVIGILQMDFDTQEEAFESSEKNHENSLQRSV